MPRQVRLDDDVAALVEDYQHAEGLKSLSSSANRMLRLAAGPEEEPDPIIDSGPVIAAAERLGETVRSAVESARVEVAPRSRRRAGRARGGIPARPRPPAPPAAVPIVAPPASTCPHPLLLRRGNRCSKCGVTV